MATENNVQLICPIRGILATRKRAKDGLKLSEDDAKNVYIPLLNDSQRQELSPYIEHLMTGGGTIRTLVKRMLKEEKLDYIEPDKRPSHVVLV